VVAGWLEDLRLHWRSNVPALPQQLGSASHRRAGMRKAGWGREVHRSLARGVASEPNGECKTPGSEIDLRGTVEWDGWCGVV
jgi:hypothetical protein